MSDPIARKRLKKKMLDRWENEGGRIATDTTSADASGSRSEDKDQGRKRSSPDDNSTVDAPASRTLTSTHRPQLPMVLNASHNTNEEIPNAMNDRENTCAEQVFSRYEPSSPFFKVDLLMIPGYYDIALRDFGLALGALALARLSHEFDR